MSIDEENQPTTGCYSCSCVYSSYFDVHMFWRHFGDMCPVKYYILHKLGAVGTGLCNKGPAHLKPAAILGRIAVGFSFNIHKYSCKIMPCQISPQ